MFVNNALIQKNYLHYLVATAINVIKTFACIALWMISAKFANKVHNFQINLEMLASLVMILFVNIVALIVSAKNVTLQGFSLHQMVMIALNVTLIFVLHVLPKMSAKCARILPN